MLSQEHTLDAADLSHTAFLDEEHRQRVAEGSPKGRFQRVPAPVKQFNDEIGYSQFKTIYRAYDAETGREVSWNTVRAGRIAEADRRNILREIGILKGLSHKNIVGCVDSWVNREKRQIIFITEIFSGGSLSSYLHKIKRPKLKIIKSWCGQIMEGLEYLHSCKPPIVHSNIKSDNIFVNANTNEIKLGEVGFLATTLDSCKSLYGSLECPIPQLAQGHIGPAADIYCFGMVMLQMATLKPPYYECVNQAQIYKRIYSQIRPMTLQEINNVELKAIITACIGPQKDRPTIAQLLAMDFWKPNDEVDRLPVQILSEDKQAPLVEQNDSSSNRPNLQIKNFSKQKPVMEVPIVEEEVALTRINALMDRKDRENQIILVFHLEGGKSCELRIPKDKDRKEQTEKCIAFLAKNMSIERQHEETNHHREQQSFTGVSWHQTKSTQNKFESSLYGSRAKYSEDILSNPNQLIIELQPTTDPIERIKEQFHCFYEQYRQSLEGLTSSSLYNSQQEEMELRFAIESHQLQRIHESDKQLRNLSRRRHPKLPGSHPNEHPSSFNLIEMLNLEGQPEADGNSIYSKDESFKNLFSKNEDMLSLNYSSIQPYNRDEQLNTDFYDWAGTNFNFLGGHDLMSYQPEPEQHMNREEPPPKPQATETIVITTTTVTTGTIFTINETQQSQEQSKVLSCEPNTSEPSSVELQGNGGSPVQVPHH